MNEEEEPRSVVYSASISIASSDILTLIIVKEQLPEEFWILDASKGMEYIVEQIEEAIAADPGSLDAL